MVVLMKKDSFLLQEMKLDWKIVVGGLIGLLGSAFGSIGGAGGGGIFVPMLTLIVGFDQKSSTALSKCSYPISNAVSSSVFSIFCFLNIN